MIKINIAGLTVQINNKYDYVLNQCADFAASDGNVDFSVEASHEDIEKERLQNPDFVGDGYLESVCIYREIAMRLPKYNAFVFHSSAVEYKGSAYCFTAKSGTGKTTHTKLWRKTLGEELKVINGDKPIVRLLGDKFYVYGTPWRGKENLGNDSGIPLKSIAVLHRAETNSIKLIEAKDSVPAIIQQVFIPKDKESGIVTLDLISKLIAAVPIYSLGCNMEDEAAILSFGTMSAEV